MSKALIPAAVSHSGTSGLLAGTLIWSQSMVPAFYPKHAMHEIRMDHDF